MTEVFERHTKLYENPTPAEAYFRKFLDKCGIEYMFQYPVEVKTGTTYFVDFYFVDYNCYVELDGKQHYERRGTRYDKGRRKLIYEARKWKEIRFPNWMVYKMTKRKLLAKLKAKKKQPIKMPKKIDYWKEYMKKMGYRDPNKIMKH